MRVTVSISCYNQEDKIANCIKSVIAQDYNDIEILVVDDHSTDKSIEVIKSVFAVHPEVLTRLIIHDTNTLFVTLVSKKLVGMLFFLWMVTIQWLRIALVFSVGK